MKIELIKETEKTGKVWYILEIEGDLPTVLGHDENYAIKRYEDAVKFCKENGSNSVKEVIKSIKLEL